MIVANLFTTVLLVAGSSFGKEDKKHKSKPTPMAEVAESHSRPWYVHAASDEIVNMCFWGGMLGGSGGMGGYSTQGSTGAITISQYYTATEDFDGYTTEYTTIPGDVITIEASAGTITTQMPDITYSTVYINTDTLSNATATVIPDESTITSAPIPTSSTSSAHHGFIAEIKRIESYAHDLAEAILAPAKMTVMLSSAYEELADHGFIHATKAVELIGQAKEAFKDLRTNPAYASQSKALATQPTAVNYKKAVSKATSSHKGAIKKMVAEPSGRKAWNDAKMLGKDFLKAFVR